MKKKKYVLKPRIKILLALLALGYFGFNMLKQEIKMNQQDQKILDLKKQIAEVEDTNTDLDRLIQYSDSEEYIEKIARERLGWVKKDEIIFIEKKND